MTRSLCFLLFLSCVGCAEKVNTTARPSTPLPALPTPETPLVDDLYNDRIGKLRAEEESHKHRIKKIQAEEVSANLRLAELREQERELARDLERKRRSLDDLQAEVRQLRHEIEHLKREAERRARLTAAPVEQDSSLRARVADLEKEVTDLKRGARDEKKRVEALERGQQPLVKESSAMLRELAQTEWQNQYLAQFGQIVSLRFGGYNTAYVTEIRDGNVHKHTLPVEALTYGRFRVGEWTVEQWDGGPILYFGPKDKWVRVNAK